MLLVVIKGGNVKLSSHLGVIFRYRLQQTADFTFERLLDIKAPWLLVEVNGKSMHTNTHMYAH